MYRANMASGTPSHALAGGLSLDGITSFSPLLSFTAFPLLAGSEPPLRLNFDPVPANGMALPAGPNAGAAMAEPKDSFRPGAEVAALLLYLRGGEAGFLPLPEEWSEGGGDPKDAPPPWNPEAGTALMAALPRLPAEAASWADSLWSGFHVAAPPDPVWSLL